MPAMLPELMLLRESPSDTSVMAVSILLEPYLEDWRRRPRMATAILKRLAKQGRSRLAATVLSAMAAHGVETNVFHYSALLTACASGGHWPWALALAQRIGCSGMQMDAVGVGTQMRACARSKRWDWPLSLLMDLRSSACQLDVVVYNTCVAHGIWERSWFLLRGIRQNKLEPDLFTFDALSASSWPASVCMLMCTVHEGVQPDVFCYNSVIAEGGVGWEGGLNMVDTMQASGLRPDVATYDASIGLCAGARWQTAFELWNILRTSCRADVVALTAVLGTCADVSKWQASVGFCEGIQTVDLISCNALVHACAKGSMWQDAVFLFDAAPGNRVLPDEATQSSLLASLSAGSCWELALSAFFEWFGKPSARTPLVCSTLLSALSAGWQWLFALELLRIMEKSSVEVSRECQNASRRRLRARCAVARSLWSLREFPRKELHRLELRPRRQGPGGRVAPSLGFGSAWILRFQKLAAEWDQLQFCRPRSRQMSPLGAFFACPEIHQASRGPAVPCGLQFCSLLSREESLVKIPQPPESHGDPAGGKRRRGLQQALELMCQHGSVEIFSVHGGPDASQFTCLY